MCWRCRVALSEEEQRLLEQMEKALTADDPKLAHTMRGDHTPRVLRRKQAVLAGFGFLIGVLLLIGGVAINGGAFWFISVIGFILMLVGTVLGLRAYQPVSESEQPMAPSRSRVGQGGGSGSDAFMSKMEERWRRRQGEDS